MTRTRKHPGTMTARQFAKASERLYVTPATLDRAWHVLVEGKTVREVAESDGVTKSLVYHAVYTVRPLSNVKLSKSRRRSLLSG